MAIMTAFARIASLGILLCSMFVFDAASAALVVTKCGSPVSSTVATGSGPDVSTKSPTFSAVPGASVVVNVPAGASRCVKVRFSAVAVVDDVGYVRAVAAGTRMQPQSDVTLVEATSSGLTQDAAHGFEWIRRVGPGTHTVSVQWRVYWAGSNFIIRNWTMDVEVTR